MQVTRPLLNKFFRKTQTGGAGHSYSSPSVPDLGLFTGMIVIFSVGYFIQSYYLKEQGKRTWSKNTYRAPKDIKPEAIASEVLPEAEERVGE